ncbi:glycosyltransferase [Hyphomicrobium methylovorum]|uniref:glycosyltransferase family 2 protein n=1 Tax=Hyphomicrobium methylovorum TaxID=84 RepID=UPI0015E78E4F|nr:glycosyltransferase [Hyphomicrobium methylovorum]MBA2127236.1 glycosyltransferase [Hyphomicrobium methylovorum]
MTATDHIAVVVSTFNRYDCLDDALQALLRQDYANYEIIVVDNSPDQNAARNYGERYAGSDRITYRLEPVAGLSRARNIGVSNSSGSIIAFIDDDAIAEPNWVSEIAAAFTSFPNAGVAGGRIFPRWSSEPPVWLTPKLYDYLSLVDLGDEMREVAPGEYLAGCNIAFLRSALSAVGGFAENLGRKGGSTTLLSSEETELTERIRRAGQSVIYNPRAAVHHIIDPARLSEEWFCKRVAWQAVSDFMADSEAMQRYAPKAAKRAMRGLKQATLPGDGTVDERLQLVYNLIIASLGGEMTFSKAKMRSHSRLARLQTAIKKLPGKLVRTR